MRLVEQVVAVLARIEEQRQAGRNEEARQELRVLCLEHTGMSLDSIQRSSPEALAESLSAVGALRPMRSMLLAELLIHEAQLSGEAKGAGGWIVCRLHAFCLIVDCIGLLRADEQEPYRKRLDDLAQTLVPMRSDPYIRSKLEIYESIRAAT
jgi:hypothetical protein